MIEIIVRKGFLRNKETQDILNCSHLEYYYSETPEQTGSNNLLLCQLNASLAALSKKMANAIILSGEALPHDIVEKARLEFEISRITRVQLVEE